MKLFLRLPRRGAQRRNSGSHTCTVEFSMKLLTKLPLMVTTPSTAALTVLNFGYLRAAFLVTAFFALTGTFGFATFVFGAFGGASACT